MANVLDAIQDELNARLERLALKTETELAELERAIADYEERAAFHDEAVRDNLKMFKILRDEKNWSERFDSVESDILDHARLAKAFREKATETREAAMLAKVTVMQCAAGKPVH
jgi:hypothetical protein